MRALCVARHAYLAEHLASVFRTLGADARAVVGLDTAAVLAPAWRPDALICDYELLVGAALGPWAVDPVLGTLPLVAVSLTRRPGELSPLDENEIGGVIYLPTLEPVAARRVLSALVALRARGVPAPPTSPVARPGLDLRIDGPRAIEAR